MFYFDEIEGYKVLKSDLFNGINHFFTTRELILKTKEEENTEKSFKNREIIRKHFNLDKIITPNQRHTNNIEIADINKDEYPDCDALVLKDKNIGIFLNFADCTPLIFYDTKNRIGAISHAGWRGTAQRIGPKTVKFMQNEFNSETGDIIALIGPCICFNCFETGEEVIEKLKNTVRNSDKLIKKVNDKYYANLKEINKTQLMEVGIERIDITSFCTCCDNEKFFSYRLENKTTNRMSAFLSI